MISRAGRYSITTYCEKYHGIFALLTSSKSTLPSTYVALCTHSERPWAALKLHHTCNCVLYIVSVYVYFSV